MQCSKLIKSTNQQSNSFDSSPEALKNMLFFIYPGVLWTTQISPELISNIIIDVIDEHDFGFSDENYVSFLGFYPRNSTLTLFIPNPL